MQGQILLPHIPDVSIISELSSEPASVGQQPYSPERCVVVICPLLIHIDSDLYHSVLKWPSDNACLLSCSACLLLLGRGWGISAVRWCGLGSPHDFYFLPTAAQLMNGQTQLTKALARWRYTLPVRTHELPLRCHSIWPAKMHVRWLQSASVPSAISRLQSPGTHQPRQHTPPILLQPVGQFCIKNQNWNTIALV